MTLVNQKIANEFVRNLGLRESEVVIDAYCGPGQITRALLAGGYDETTAADWKKVVAEQRAKGLPIGQVAAETKRRRVTGGTFDFPPWDMSDVESPKYSKKPPSDLITPKLVIANDPKISSLARGLGFDLDDVPPSKWELEDPPQSGAEEPKELAKTRPLVYPSALQPNLVLSPITVYHWSTIPMILENPLVAPNLPVFDASKDSADQTKRPWNAPPPPLTLLATIPDGPFGDQLVNQWVMSATSVGGGGKRGWLWQWGRVRMALLINRGLYDVRLMRRDPLTSQRLTANVGSPHNCKLTILARALFDIRPLPPFHHIEDPPETKQLKAKATNRRKQAKAEGEPAEFATRRAKAKYAFGGPTVGEVTKTYAGDFYPVKEYSSNMKAAQPDLRLVRPHLLGVELVPKAESVLKPEQREAWDYILRKLFVRDTISVGESLPALAFGAENLMEKIQTPNNGYSGEAVLPHEIIRDLKPEQFARIVDVFDKWAFKPDVGLLGMTLPLTHSSFSRTASNLNSRSRARSVCREQFVDNHVSNAFPYILHPHTSL